MEAEICDLDELTSGQRLLACLLSLPPPPMLARLPAAPRSAPKALF